MLKRLGLDKQLKKDLVFLRIAHELATLSHCVSHMVGCIFVKNGRIIMSGINGTPAGYKNCDEVFERGNFNREAHHKWSNQYEVHAEINGVLFTARHAGIALEGSTVYSTLQPCPECVKNLVPSGIVRVVFSHLYDKGTRLGDVAEFYKGFEIPIEHLPLEDA